MLLLQRLSISLFTHSRVVTYVSFLLVLLIVLAGCVPSALLAGTPSRTPLTSASRVIVDANKTLASIPVSAFGMNTAVWDNHLLDPDVPNLLRQAGVTMLRFPGGSTSDVYHWKSHTSTKNQAYVNHNTTFDAFMHLTEAIGAQAFITVNYGTNETGTGGGDPAEAADWVRYANQTRQYGVKYWEIGNEVYGNGSYSPRWEADLHPAKGPAAYANNVLKFAEAMKAVDPSIKVGAAVTTPNPTSGNQPMADWNSTLFSLACSQIDFVDVHWYPRWRDQDGGSPDDQLLSRPMGVPAMIQQLRTEMAQHCGERAKSIKIVLGEVNTDIAIKQRVSLVNALFLADVYMAWLTGGGSNVSWWDLHEGSQFGSNDRSAYGSTNYGSLGVLSNGDCKNGDCQPLPNTPFPPYYGLQMLTHLGKPGDQIIEATSSARLVSVHAVKQANGNLALMLINKDPHTSVTLHITLSGYQPASTATVYAFGMNSSAPSSNSVQLSVAPFIQTLPPYSLTTLLMTPRQ